MAEEEREVEEAPAQGGKNPLLTILLLVNFIMMTSIAFLQFKSFKKESEKKDIRDIIKAEVSMIEQEKSDDEKRKPDYIAEESEGFLFNLDNFTANLAQDDGPRRFVRVNIVLKFSKEAQSEEVDARKPQLRDSVIGILNSKRAKDLLAREGKNVLKEEIKSTINSYLIEGYVKDVYYVGFQIN